MERIPVDQVIHVKEQPRSPSGIQDTSLSYEAKVIKNNHKLYQYELSSIGLKPRILKDLS
jgi:hypothetical protein